MSSSLSDLQPEELKKLLSRETRSFINALDNGSTVEELQEIRARIKKIRQLLETKGRGKKTT